MSAGVIVILPADQSKSDRAISFMHRFQDIPCDYADGTVLVAAEETDIRQIFTLDQHFYACRLSDGSALDGTR